MRITIILNVYKPIPENMIYVIDKERRLKNFERTYIMQRGEMLWTPRS